MLNGSDTLVRLAEVTSDSSSQADPGASSHWRAQHKDFVFTGSGFENLQGFGGTERHPSVMRTFAHRLLMQPYKRMGAELSGFEADLKAAGDITNSQSRLFNLDVLRQCLTVAFLRDQKQYPVDGYETVCVIGDGFGLLSTLLLNQKIGRRVVLVNLSKTLLVDLWYVRAWMGEEKFQRCVTLVENEADVEAAFEQESCSLISVQAKDSALVGKFPIDLAINIASMQEMDPPVVQAYFASLRESAALREQPVLFYCCNREEKVLEDGTLVRFADYGWQASDEVILDELCPWHQDFYQFGWPPYRPYDGPIRHRLACLDPAELSKPDYFAR